MIPERRVINCIMVEAAGIEPASENTPRKTSTGLGRVFSLALRIAPGRAVQGQFAQSTLARENKQPHSNGLIKFTTGFIRLPPSGATALIKQPLRKRNCFLWQLHCCRFLRGQRRLDLLLWLLRPRRNQGAPKFFCYAINCYLYNAERGKSKTCPTFSPRYVDHGPAFKAD